MRLLGICFCNISQSEWNSPTTFFTSSYLHTGMLPFLQVLTYTLWCTSQQQSISSQQQSIQAQYLTGIHRPNTNDAVATDNPLAISTNLMPHTNYLTSICESLTIITEITDHHTDNHESGSSITNNYVNILQKMWE